MRAINSIGKVLAPYDSDGMIPVWGFGAVVDGKRSNLFPLDPAIEVKGIDGVLNAYKNSFEKVQLAGPSNFESVIKEANKLTSKPWTPANQHYSILLVLTDGKISDMNKTVPAIAEASRNPLSIVIVGVGNSDEFGDMEKLDADGKLLECFADVPGPDGIKVKTPVKAMRDIVHFFPMKNYEGISGAELARVTLQEVPTQVVEYTRQNKVYPLPSKK